MLQEYLKPRLESALNKFTGRSTIQFVVSDMLTVTGRSTIQFMVSDMLTLTGRSTIQFVVSDMLTVTVCGVRHVDCDSLWCQTC
jgi:23S rRNA U2552 (ribose-2'-O)-methylase RlmE/FtsJ